MHPVAVACTTLKNAREPAKQVAPLKMDATMGGRGGFQPIGAMSLAVDPAPDVGSGTASGLVGDPRGEAGPRIAP